MNLLLAVDGSEQSYEALRALAHLARADKLAIVHAMDVPVPMYPSVFPEVAKDIQETVERTMREEGERLLQRVTSLLPPGMGAVSKHLAVGKPTDVIVDVAAQQPVQLIVMGARGVGAIRELLMGSVSHRVVSQAACPVLVVRGAVKALNQILLAIETQEDAERAINFLKQQPFRQSCTVTVLTVIPYATPAWPVGAIIPDTYRQSILSQAREFVTEAATRLAAEGYRATGEATLGAPAMQILHEAHQRKADLIMLGSQHRGMGRLMLGSVSHTVLHRADCPVLVFR
jgi:nucleotide-binding universal stress UspA family protein